MSISRAINFLSIKVLIERDKLNRVLAASTFLFQSHSTCVCSARCTASLLWTTNDVKPMVIDRMRENEKKEKKKINYHQPWKQRTFHRFELFLVRSDNAGIRFNLVPGKFCQRTLLTSFFLTTFKLPLNARQYQYFKLYENYASS